MNIIRSRQESVDYQTTTTTSRISWIIQEESDARARVAKKYGRKKGGEEVELSIREELKTHKKISFADIVGCESEVEELYFNAESATK